MKFSGDGSFELCFGCNYDLMLAISCGEDWKGRVCWLLEAICQCTCARMMHQPHVHAWSALDSKFFKIFISETSPHKKISKKKSSPCRDGSMHALADKVHKQEVPCTQWYALHNTATLFNDHSYISSSGTLVGTKFIATYARKVVE